MGTGGRKFFRVQELCQHVQTTSLYPSNKQRELLSEHFFFSCLQIGLVAMHFLPLPYFFQFLDFFYNCKEYNSYVFETLWKLRLKHCLVAYAVIELVIKITENYWGMERKSSLDPAVCLSLLSYFEKCQEEKSDSFGSLHPLVSHFIIPLISVQNPQLWYTLVKWGLDFYLIADISSLRSILMFVLQSLGPCLWCF